MSTENFTATGQPVPEPARDARRGGERGLPEQFADLGVGELLVLLDPARFSSMSGRWRQAPASPSRCARKEPVAAAVTKRASCPRTKKGSMCGNDERGRSLTSRLREFCVPSRVAVGLRLPPVEALPMW